MKRELQIILKVSALVPTVLGCALAVRLAAMMIIPLTDSTEARFGEITRLMLETGDWITPYIDYGVPYWGKPPLAFWLGAGSNAIFGGSEFAGRLPSLLAILGCMACLYHFVCDVWNRHIGLWTLVIFATTAVVYVQAGAILTDPFLVFGTTLSMVSMTMALRYTRSAWRYIFFVGLAVGILAKGPIALVLVAGSLGAWVILKNQWRSVWLAVPWFRGLCLTAILTLPWYFVAELHTPGFLEYFIIGEHWMRYTEPGWQDDLYGRVHRGAYGKIWLYWLYGSFPWGLLVIWRLLPGGLNKAGRRALVAAAANNQTSYLLSWALFPLVFFTFTSNVLWTYVLPAMPAFAILLAAMLVGEPKARPDVSRRLITGFAWVAPALSLVLIVFFQFNPTVLKTEKYLVEAYDEYRHRASTLVYIADRPFSARFYTHGQVRFSTYKDLISDLATRSTESEFVAIPNYLLSGLEPHLLAPLDVLFTNGRFSLIRLAEPKFRMQVSTPSP